MALIVGLIGVVVGWSVTILSDWLPRYAQYSRPKLRQRNNRQLAIWQVLRGHRADSWFLHAAIELVTGFVFAIAFALYDTNLYFGVTILEVSVFILIVVIDFKYRLILNIVIYPMTIVFPLINIFLLHQNALFVILGGAFAYSIFYATARLRPDLGMGDVKLALLIGVTVGFPGVLWALLLGAGLGGIVAIYLITTGRGKRDTMIAYAPYLCFGVMVLLLLRPLFSTI